MTDNLRQSIREYIAKGGVDAFAFSIVHAREFGDVAGEELQRMIDDEVERKKEEAD